MNVILPAGAKIKNFAGRDLEVEALEPGLKVVGYDLRLRQLVVISIDTVSAVESREGAYLYLKDLEHPKPLLLDTQLPQAVNRHQSVCDGASALVVCPVNPAQTKIRVHDGFDPIGRVDSFKVTWSNPSYLLAQGVLVGSPE